MQSTKTEWSYDDFKKRVKKEVEYRVDGLVSIQQITKNNGLKLDGLTILAGDTNISPTIYLNYYYDKFLQHGLDAVVEEILEVYEQNRPKEALDISFFTDAHKIRNKIKMKIVNYERNKELLKKVPHVKFLDLAIIFYAEVENNVDGIATILIYHHHMVYWDFTTEDLFKLANENMADDFKIIPMMEIVHRVMEKEFAELFERQATVEMSVITNHRNINGAVAMLQTNLLLEDMKKHHAERLNVISVYITVYFKYHFFCPLKT